jgi:hypothetical protein
MPPDVQPSHTRQEEWTSLTKKEFPRFCSPRPPPPSRQHFCRNGSTFYSGQYILARINISLLNVKSKIQLSLEAKGGGGGARRSFTGTKTSPSPQGHTAVDKQEGGWPIVRQDTACFSKNLPVSPHPVSLVAKTSSQPALFSYLFCCPE